MLQYVDLGMTESEEDIKNEVRRLRSEGRLSQVQAQAIDAGSVFGFFSSPLGRRIVSADNVLRVPLFAALPADSLFDVPQRGGPASWLGTAVYKKMVN
jgi:hypothetical protein